MQDNFNIGDTQMFIKIKDVRRKEGRYTSKVLYPCAYILASDYSIRQIEELRAKGMPLEKWSLIDQIGIVGDEPIKLGCTLVFSEYKVISKEREESLLETLKEHNLAINDKGAICFYDYSKICFEIDDNVLTYDEFCQYELPEGKVFKFVYDNGYSYIGSNPFHGTAKQYADRAIGAAKDIKHIWGGWMHGFRLNDIYCIDVAYGKDESYSCVSNT